MLIFDIDMFKFKSDMLIYSNLMYLFLQNICLFIFVIYLIQLF